MNKKMWIIGLTVLITAIGILAAVSTPDGSTRDNREKLIQDIPHGDNWKIAVEQTFEDHIIAGIYSSGNRYGIAVFEPVGKENYRLQTYHSRDLARTFIHSLYLNEEWYSEVERLLGAPLWKVRRKDGKWNFATLTGEIICSKW